MTRWSVLFLALLAIVACSNPFGGDDAPGEQTEKVAKSGKKKGKKGGKGKRKKGKKGTGDGTTAPAAAADPQVVAAYLADCHHTFPDTREYDLEGDPSDECRSYEFEQNCSGDPSGCWGKGQDCVAACGPVCGSCQDTCAATCDTCKDTCAGDAACLQGCAEVRATCRTTCMADRETCMGTTCAAAESACEAEYQKKRAEKCPDCDAIRACMMEDMSAPDRQQACQQRYPSNAPDCVSLCGFEM